MMINLYLKVLNLGPLESTVPEFWKMIWNEKVPVIAMLTRTFDFIKGETIL